MLNKSSANYFAIATVQVCVAHGPTTRAQDFLNPPYPKPRGRAAIFHACNPQWMP